MTRPTGRPGRRRRSHGIVTTVYALTTTVGIGLMVYTSYLLVRQPFLGRAPLPRAWVLPTLAGFVVGTILFTWGTTRLEAAFGG